MVVSIFCFGLIGFHVGELLTLAGITSSEATVVVLQFSRVMGGVQARARCIVLLYKTCSTERSDSTIMIGRMSMPRSAERACEGQGQGANIFFDFVGFCSAFHV